MLDLYHSANTDEILKVDLYYLANTLTNTHKILKVIFYHLANILANTNHKTNDIIEERLVASNQLLTLCHWMIIKNDNFISQQVDDLQIDT